MEKKNEVQGVPAEDSGRAATGSLSVGSASQEPSPSHPSREYKFRAWDDLRMYVPLHIERNGYAQREYGWAYERDHIMQFTGIVDRAGKEIYEDDIVSIPSIDPRGNIDYDTQDGRSIVRFENGCFGIMRREFMPLFDWMEKSAGEYIPNYGNATIYGKCVLLVVGNVHQHPELFYAPNA